MDEADSTAPNGGTWYAATRVDAPERPPLHIDLDVDVCVIGGGLAGLTTAREVARSGRSVVLIEASRLGAQASGRSTGFVLPGFAAEPEAIVDRTGFAQAKDLWALSESGLDYVRNAIRDDAMAGIELQDGWLNVSKIDNGDELTRLVKLISDLGGDVEIWPAERLRSVLHSARYFHAIHFPRAFHIHPLNYALGLATAAERDGARIFEQTPALSIDPAGVRKRIVTPGARLRAEHVVLCGNLQIGTLLPKVASTLIPITTYVITTAPLGPKLGEAIAYRGAVSDSELADNHYRVVDNDRLMWSGRATIWQADPRRYVRALTGDIGRTYPQLGEIAVDYAWSGVLGHPVHRMPQIGELGPGLWLASGFGGHGLNTTAMAGNLVARAITEGDQAWRQFTPFELVWAGGMFGRAAAQLYYWLRRLGDAVAERRSRFGEAARRRAGEIEGAQTGTEQPPEAPENNLVADREIAAASLPNAETQVQADSANRSRRRRRHLGAKA